MYILKNIEDCYFAPKSIIIFLTFIDQFLIFASQKGVPFFLRKNEHCNLGCRTQSFATSIFFENDASFAEQTKEANVHLFSFRKKNVPLEK